MIALEEKQGLDLVKEAFIRHKKEATNLRVETDRQAKSSPR
jgi:hypothetical protein